MKLNAQKTSLLCISAAKSYQPRTYIDLGEGDLVTSGKSLKLLGFHFDTTLTIRALVKSIL